MNILLLSPYPPFPPYGGGTMRVFQLIRGLAAQHRVTCLTFSPNQQADQALAPLREHCQVQIVRGPEARSLRERARTTLTTPLPDMALRNQSRAYAAALHALLAQEAFDIVQAESIEMAGYLSLVPAGTRRVLDQFNAEYTIQKRAALTSMDAIKHGNLSPQTVAGALYSTAQWLKLARYERNVMRASDLVLAVSEEDRQTMLGLDRQLSIAVVPNGVDTQTFSRAALNTEHVGLTKFAKPTLVFSGTLDYRPNVDAVLWFAHEVLPLVQARCPAAQLIVVGKHPTPVLRSLPAPAVTIVGEVPDARPYIAGADVYVVPMRIGGGVRLKLLEALALEAPTVTTALGAEGVVGLRHNTHCLIADDPQGFAHAVLDLIAQPEKGQYLGAAGRTLVREHYDWQAIIPRLNGAYQR